VRGGFCQMIALKDMGEHLLGREQADDLGQEVHGYVPGRLGLVSHSGAVRTSAIIAPMPPPTAPTILSMSLLAIFPRRASRSSSHA